MTQARQVRAKLAFLRSAHPGSGRTGQVWDCFAWSVRDRKCRSLSRRARTSGESQALNCRYTRKCIVTREDTYQIGER
jgi:hypothetical protein